MVTFKNNDAAFFDWLDENERAGFFVNQRAKRDQWMLHVATCPHIDRSPTCQWTKNPKTCSTERRELETWVTAQHGALTKCNECFG